MSDEIVLCVDDDPTVLNALRTLLSTQLGRGHVVEIAESGPEALEICEELHADGRELAVIISDYIMPGMHGDELLAKVHEMSPNTMKILLTGQSDIEGVKRAINEANLYRFLEKPFSNDDIVLTTRAAHRAYTQERELERQNEFLRRINSTLEGLVEQRTHELLAKNQELERLSITDRLTGIYNRLKLDQILFDELARYQRYGTVFSILMCDVDKFKSVNDTFGHKVGDQVLVGISRILSERAREADAVGRWGGEEFLVVCRNSSIEGAQVVAETIRESIGSHAFPTVGLKTASIGVTSCRPNDSVVDMMERADAALYRAKEKGRNRVELNP